MTVPVQAIYSTYTGDGVTTSFNLACKVFLAADCQAFTFNPGVDTIPNLVTSGVTWTVAPDYSYATAVFTTAPAVGMKIGLIRRMDMTQNVSVSSTNYVPPSVMEQALDRQMMAIQEAALFSTLPLKSDPFGFTQSTRVNGAIVFDANGNQTFVLDPFPMRGIWSSLTAYNYRDVVTRNGTAYISRTANTNIDPATDNGTNWQVLGGDVPLDPNLISWEAVSRGAGFDAFAAAGPFTLAAYVSSIANLQAIDTTKITTAILTASGREGVFMWRSGDFSSLISADAAQGLYVKANAVAANLGAWVRRRDDLDAQISWFGAVVGANAGANAAANNAAWASAKALSNVLTVNFSQGIYEISATMSLDRSGLSLQGYSAFPVFGTGGSTGTILKWTGTSGGVAVQIRDASSNDTYNNKIRGIEIDGNALVAVGIDIYNAQFPVVENCNIRNLRTSSTSLGLRTQSTAVAGTGINCVYRGSFRNISISVGGTSCGVYASGTSGVGNTTFCVYENIHVTHENDAAFYLVGCDDLSFFNCASSRVAGGTGAGIKYDGTGSTWVVGNTVFQFHCGVTDGTASVIATGAKARQNKIYGLSGVDNAPTVTITGGAALQYDYLGTGYTSNTASEAALNKMTEAHLTAVRIGSDFSTYATGTRDVNANDKVIWNNPGTGGFEWQIGGVASIDYTLGTLTLTSAAAGAGAGPTFDLFRNKASAVSDTIGYVSFSGQSSLGAKRTYVDAFVTITDNTDGSEDAQFQLRGMVNGTLTAFYTLTVNNATFTSGIKSSNAAQGIGYTTGAGGTVTQATSRTTGVTLNRPSGQITTNNTSLAAASTAKFTVSNSAVAAIDTVDVSIASGSTTDQTDVKVQGVRAGAFDIVVANRHASTAETGAIVINYNVIKGASS